MNTLVKAVVAIVIGMIVTGVLEYFNLLNQNLDILIGIVVALVYFFSYGDWHGPSRA